MIHHMDEGIGKVLGSARSDRRENTIVVFTGDNGGERFSDTYPLMGKKMDLLEGGIRVPFVLRWPARVPAGKQRRAALGDGAMDWTPTFLGCCRRFSPSRLSAGRRVAVAAVRRCVLGSTCASSTGGWRIASSEPCWTAVWKYLRVEGERVPLQSRRSDERERANLAVRKPHQLADMRAAWMRWSVE